MNISLMQAFITIFNECMKQDDCKTCPMKDLCQKMPSDWEPKAEDD